MKRQPKPATGTDTGSYWLVLALSVLAVKAGLYSIDSHVGFVLGDSASYLKTAYSGWIPPDRSYVYGYLVRWATLGNQSLDFLVRIQVLISAINCLLLAFILIRFLSCGRWVAGIAALVCAFEPISVLYERYVMTEVFGLLPFALFLITILYYLRNGQVGLLLLAAALGVFAASLRMAYLPVVLGVGSLAVLYYSVFVSKRGLVAESNGVGRAATGVTHLLIFLLVSGFFQLLESKPKVVGGSGGFLLAAWSPLLAEPPFSENPEILRFTDGSPCALTWKFRKPQQWWPDCLMGKIHKHFLEQDEKLTCDDYQSELLAGRQTNQFARSLAMQLLVRYPLGVLEIGLKNWTILWDRAELHRVLHVDQGGEFYPPDFIDDMKQHYDLDVEGWNHTVTLARSYFDSAVGWYWLVILSPMLLIVWWVTTMKTLGPAPLVITASSVALLLIITIPVSAPSIRLYYTIAWLAIIGLASALGHWCRRCR